MTTTDGRIEGKFAGKGKVTVRCGGRGAEMVGREIHVKTKAGRWRVIRLAALVRDWGVGDVCEFTVEFTGA